jgi:RHS repeat-associated protein
VFFGGKRVALVPATGGALYYAEDLLGSSRVMVQANGTLCYDADFTPFGGEVDYTSTCAQNYKFEGKERDTETENDDFGARYYSWRFGRWLSSDWSAVPAAVPYANLTNPQTLNLYSMVGDDPESFADLDGHGDQTTVTATVNPTGGGCSSPDECSPAINDGASAWSGFISCFSNALVSDNLAGIGRQDPTNSSGTIGAAVGDFVSVVQGGVEVLAGGAAQGGGVAACGTGVGCLVTAPAVVAGTAAEVHGATTAAEGFGHLLAKSIEGTKNGETSATQAGREAHKEFADKVSAKPGWQSEPTIKGPNGKNLRPDAISPKGHPVELKPNTPSGRARGASQLQRYENATGKNGRVVYYEP